MKLSDLETLVAAMRARANAAGNKDPNVELFDPSPEGCTGFYNYTISQDIADEIHEHEVLVSGTQALSGDFAIPLIRT